MKLGIDVYSTRSYYYTTSLFGKEKRCGSFSVPKSIMDVELTDGSYGGGHQLLVCFIDLFRVCFCAFV